MALVRAKSLVIATIRVKSMLYVNGDWVVGNLRLRYWLDVAFHLIYDDFWRK